MYTDYCDKCGWTWLHDNDNTGDDNFCEICGNRLKPVPDKYFEDPNFKVMLSKPMKKKLIEELVFTSPNFDQYYFDNAINIKGQKDAQFNAIKQMGSNTPKCPKCGCTNIQVVRRNWSFLRGFATNKTDRVCANCNYKW